MATPITRATNNLPTVVLIGRFNVGKSTLFNRLLEENKAIVSDIPGTTRTNNEGAVLWRGKYIRLVDTGGLTFDEKVPFETEIQTQSANALAAADLIVLVTDGRVGVVPEDRAYAQRLRTKAHAPILIVVNKVDNQTIENELELDSWQQLGFGDPFLVSAASGRAVGDLLDQFFVRLQKGKRRPKQIKETKLPSIRVSIIGRPNVGKSSLFNQFIGEKKVIVSPIAHTTREPYDTTVVYEYTREKPQISSSPSKGEVRRGSSVASQQTEVVRQPFIFVDTAGIRRKARVEGELEQIGIAKSIHSISESDIVLFVLDGSEPISSQDMQLGGLLEKRSPGVIILLNKWDLSTNNTDQHRNEVKKMIYSHFPHIDFAPIVFVSGLDGYRVHTIFPLLIEVWKARHTEIPPEVITQFLKQVTHEHRPARDRGTRHPRLLGFHQLGTNPPVFELLIKQNTSLHISYVRFLERRLREQFAFTGTPIIIKLSKMKR